MKKDTPITMPTVAHIATQIRVKQLGIQTSQNKRLAAIQEWLAQNSEIVDKYFREKILGRLEQWITVGKQIDSYLDDQQKRRNAEEAKLRAENPEIKSEADIAAKLGRPPLGWPIRCRKNLYLLEWIKPYISKDGLIDRLQSGNLIHNLQNKVTDELPTLASPDKEVYWGNGNHILASVLLDVIYASCCAEAGAKLTPMAGTSTFYRFENESFKLPASLALLDYPFVSEEGMLLYGEYQYGGHSYFKDRWLLRPEDCSSSVGKALGLSHEQVEYISTQDMIAAYKQEEGAKKLEIDYDCNRVTAFPQGETIGATQLELIEPGDILLMSGHIVVVAEKPDSNGMMTTLEFAQGLQSTPRVFGGGSATYNLHEKVAKTELFFLRPRATTPLRETWTAKQLLDKIDSRFSSFYAQNIVEKRDDYEQFFKNLYT